MIESDSAVDGLRVSVLGGTGPQGRGLARRFATAGFPVVIGSRSTGRAEETPSALATVTRGRVSGIANDAAARVGDIVVIAIPWAGHGDHLSGLVGALAGKIVVDCVNPLGFDKHGVYALHAEEGSAAQQAAALLPDSRVVAAFHHVSWLQLDDPTIESLATDVLVLGQDREATDLVQSLADAVPGMRGVYGGPLRNAHQVEALTANLISINRRNKVHSGLRVTDV
jgi:NADPH-dependent F420 reductase